MFLRLIFFFFAESLRRTIKLKNPLLPSQRLWKHFVSLQCLVICGPLTPCQKFLQEKVTSHPPTPFFHMLLEDYKQELDSIWWLSRAADFGDKDSRALLIRKSERAAELMNPVLLYWCGRSFANAKNCNWELPPFAVGIEQSIKFYRSVSNAARSAALCFVWAAKRLGLVKDVALVIAKSVFSRRGHELGVWTAQMSPITLLPQEVVEKLFSHLDSLSDMRSLARTCFTCSLPLRLSVRVSWISGVAREIANMQSKEVRTLTLDDRTKFVHAFLKPIERCFAVKYLSRSKQKKERLG